MERSTAVALSAAKCLGWFFGSLLPKPRHGPRPSPYCRAGAILLLRSDMEGNA